MNTETTLLPTKTGISLQQTFVEFQYSPDLNYRNMVLVIPEWYLLKVWQNGYSCYKLGSVFPEQDAAASLFRGYRTYGLEEGDMYRFEVIRNDECVGMLQVSILEDDIQIDSSTLPVRKTDIHRNA